MITINNELELAIPEDFHEMSDDETAGLRVGSNGESICLKAPDLHMIISIGWKQNKGVANFLSKLLNGDDIVKSLDSCYRKSMKPFGYKRTDDISRPVDGIQADGIRYEYQAQGIDMTGESMGLKKDDELYYLHVYYRTEFRDNCRAVWKEILDSAKWK